MPGALNEKNALTSSAKVPPGSDHPAAIDAVNFSARPSLPCGDISVLRVRVVVVITVVAVVGHEVVRVLVERRVALLEPAHVTLVNVASLGQLPLREVDRLGA